MNRITRAQMSDRSADPSTHFEILRENLELPHGEWQKFLRFAREGFVNYEKATSVYPRAGLTLSDVPDDWWGSPEPMGHVFLQVARRANRTLAASVAWYLLQVYVPEIDDNLIAPGTGAAWLLLAKAGNEAPVAPAELGRQAVIDPENFFHGVSEDELLPLCRLIVEGPGTIRAWDIHAVLASVASAKIHVRAPFRLFVGLMSAEWLTSELKREFCRGVLGCATEVERLGEQRATVEATKDSSADHLDRFPRGLIYAGVSGIGDHLSTLKRYAVFALVESAGEPLREVIAEFFLKKYPDPAATEAVSVGVLDLIGLHARGFEPKDLRQWINKAIKRGLAPVRQAAYRIGAEHFGTDFVRSALNDDSGTIRKWASHLLAGGRLQPARKTRSNLHT